MSFKKKINTCVIVVMLLVGQVVLAQDSSLSDSVWGIAARQNHVDQYILYAVGIVESGKVWDDGLVRPWPWTLNIKGESVYCENELDALSKLQEARKGTSIIDIGPCQVNLKYHGDRVSSVYHLLDYSTNIFTAAKILAESIQSSPSDLVLGVGRYHNWADEGRARSYGKRVILLANELREASL